MMKFDSDTYRVSDSGPYGMMFLIAAGLGLLLCSWTYTQDTALFYYGYLTSFIFWITIGLGGLFFTLLHHLTGASWSTVIRRMLECVATTLPFMALFFIPVLLGMHDLYHWTHEDVISVQKAGYLNVTFFAVRGLVAFAIWAALGFSLYRLSRKQDNQPTAAQTFNMRRISAGGMVLYAFSSTMVAFDWLMSLDPHWFSTIFGVHFFAGSFLSINCLAIVVFSTLRKRKVLDKVVTVEHFHDLGKLAFAFTIFWAYIGFSQYFIQWYGNVPEETAWYLSRWEGNWKGVSLLIMFGHFALPFLILVFRSVKRNVPLLRIVALWLLFIHFVDMYWLVYPTHLEQGPTFSVIETAALFGPMLLIGGVFLWIFWKRFSGGPLVPVNDSKLEDSIAFVNH